MIECTIGDIVDFYNEHPDLIGLIDVDTQYGLKAIEYADVTAFDSIVHRVLFANGKSINGSPDHLLQASNGEWIPLKDIEVGDTFKSRHGDVSVIDNVVLDDRSDLYDLQIADVKEFYANDIVSHNSTMMYALSLGLFGKVTGVKKPTLVNDINLKDCVVEIHCNNNGKKIFVRRGIKPEIFDIIIDDELVDQSASNRDYQKWFEEYVLGFNLQAFQQVCFITGATYTPFFLLSAGARRKMVEDLLSITIFSRMYSLHLLESNQIKDKINKTIYDIEATEETIISLKKALNELSSKDSTFKEMIQNGIDAINDNIKSLESSKDGLESKLLEIGASQSDLIDLKKLQTKLNQATKIDGDLVRSKTSAEKFIKFLSENDNCPTCNSSLNDEFKSQHTCIKETKIIEVDQARVNLQNVISEVTEKIEVITNRQKEFKNVQDEINKVNREINQLRERVVEENKKLNSVGSANESNLKRDIIEKSASLKSLKDLKITTLVDKQYNELQGAILKDSGIKTRIINQMLPKMNQMLQHYTQQMELGMNIVIDENFNETIYRRFKDPTNYGGLSAGEKTRVDIAMFFTWREIAKAKNSLNCNLLLLDEIFDNTLDGDGLDIFISLLRKDFKDSNVFMISHRPEIVDKFESNIVIEMHGNFSKIA